MSVDSFGAETVDVAIHIHVFAKGHICTAGLAPAHSRFAADGAGLLLLGEVWLWYVWALDAVV